MLPLTALAVAAVSVLAVAVVAIVLVLRRRRLPAADRRSPGPLIGLLIGAVLVATVVWGVATLAMTGIADLLNSIRG